MYLNCDNKNTRNGKHKIPLKRSVEQAFEALCHSKCYSNVQCLMLSGLCGQLNGYKSRDKHNATSRECDG